MTDIHEKLIHAKIFRNVDSSEMLKILSHVHYQVKHFGKNEIIALSGDDCRELLILLNGSVRGEMIDYSGKTIKIEDVKGPETVASAFIFGKENQFPVNITANEHVDILFISRDSLLKIFQENQQILKNFLDDISTRSQFLTRKMRFLSFKTIQGKFAHYLLSLLKQDQITIELPKTQTELAIFFGVARPSLSRVIAEMEENGIIKTDKKTVTVIDQHRLKEMAV